MKDVMGVFVALAMHFRLFMTAYAHPLKSKSIKIISIDTTSALPIAIGFNLHLCTASSLNFRPCFHQCIPQHYLNTNYALSKSERRLANRTDIKSWDLCQALLPIANEYTMSS